MDTARILRENLNDMIDKKKVLMGKQKENKN